MLLYGESYVESCFNDMRNAKFFRVLSDSTLEIDYSNIVTAEYSTLIMTCEKKNIPDN
jgi:hypothetical protein